MTYFGTTDLWENEFDINAVANRIALQFREVFEFTEYTERPVNHGPELVITYP